MTASRVEARRIWAPLEPLRERVYRRIWSASVISNFGQLILGVGAAWEMTRLTSSPGMVALVQTALMVPLMLVSVPAGAIADMFDRRKIALVGLGFATLCAFGLAGAAAAALVPLVARDLLKGNASTYGLLLGCTGAGAVIGALLVNKARDRLSAEQAFGLCACAAGLMLLVIGASRVLLLTAAAMILAGAANMLSIALISVSVQLSVPRWVAARAIAGYQASLTGGIALGAWGWGRVAAHWGLEVAYFASGAALCLTPLIGLLMPMRRTSPTDVEMIVIGAEPEVALDISARSGPIVIEIDYQVDPAEARQFYQVMFITTAGSM